MTSSGSLLSGEQGTAKDAVRGYPKLEDATRALVQGAGWLRSRTDLVQNDVVELHHTAQSYDLDARAAAKARRSVQALLSELSDRGMAWADIARLVGVSVSAVRKWRADGPSTPENRLQLAQLAAFLDFLAELAIDDPAQWMEMRLPLPEGYRVTGMDLYQAGGRAPLLDYAGQRRSAEETLDEIRPGWRESRSDFEVYEAPDGAKAFRVRGQ